MSPIFGTVFPGYESVRPAFLSAQASDIGGAQLAVYRQGFEVVDLWTGSDPVRGRPFDGQGIALFMSITKGLTYTLVHLLVERGILSYDYPVATYWPEFAQNRKEKITLRMVLCHSAGLSTFPADTALTGEDLVFDWNKVTRTIAGMTTFWEPGTSYLYAPFTVGYILGEVIRRVMGKTVGTLLREEIADPLNLNLWIGLPKEQENLVIPELPFPPAPEFPTREPHGPSSKDMERTARLVAAYSKAFGPSRIFELINTPKGRAVELPGSNGVGDARCLAKFFAHLIGSVEGHPPILKQETLLRAVEPHTDGLSFPPAFNLLIQEKCLRFGLEYQRSSTILPMLGPSSFGHFGMGRRLVLADLHSGISLAYVCNNPGGHPIKPDPKWDAWLAALRDVVRRQSV